jgi:uncharacterized protein YwqG
MQNPDFPQGPGGSREDAISELKRKMAHGVRPAWLPVTTEGDGAVTDSKFSGKPVLKKGESWPACANCGKPMQLFVQLNLSKLPTAANVKGEGYLQMFYCTSYEPHCEVECEAFFHFSKSTLLRIVSENEIDTSVEAPAIEEAFPAKKIGGWEEITDYPGYDERSEEGLEMNDNEQELADESNIGPRAGDKLGGWPLWVQSVEYPSCPECGSRMELVLQVDSEDNVPYMWGDCGVGHITQCQAHPQQLAFGWACY